MKKEGCKRTKEEAVVVEDHGDEPCFWHEEDDNSLLETLLHSDLSLSSSWQPSPHNNLLRGVIYGVIVFSLLWCGGVVVLAFLSPPSPTSNEGLRASWRELSREDAKEKADVVFVGAGPVGLWTAVQLKLASPQTNVLMLEKYIEYQRSHVLKVDPASFKVGTQHLCILFFASG